MENALYTCAFATEVGEVFVGSVCSVMRVFVSAAVLRVARQRLSGVTQQEDNSSQMRWRVFPAIRFT